jgi:hypothetical protein
LYRRECQKHGDKKWNAFPGRDGVLLNHPTTYIILVQAPLRDYQVQICTDDDFLLLDEKVYRILPFNSEQDVKQIKKYQKNVLDTNHCNMHHHNNHAMESNDYNNLDNTTTTYMTTRTKQEQCSHVFKQADCQYSEYLLQFYKTTYDLKIKEKFYLRIVLNKKVVYVSKPFYVCSMRTAIRKRIDF